MFWPRTPVPRLQRFRPPFCPWPGCPEHLRRTGPYPFRRHGHYLTPRGRRVPRFRCPACGRLFSRQSFSTTYYLKRPELLLPIAAALQAGSSHRQIARCLGCAPSTVTRLSARLGRHALLLIARALRSLQGQLHEPLVVDHFETFELDQSLALGIATPVGASSWFLYGLDPAPHRRPLKRHRPRIPAPSGPPGYRGHQHSFRRLLDQLLPLRAEGRPLRLITDGLPAYRQALRRHPLRGLVRLACFPNPKRAGRGKARSPEALARDRAMFPVDALHALLRHSVAHHRRETIAFGRRLNAILERMFLTAVWRNFVKGRSERRPDRTTPAMRLGLAREPWGWRRVLARRLFVARESLPEVWGQLYRREWPTPALPTNTTHALRQAF